MRAQVIDNARERWDKDADKAALRKRVTFVGGDFFKQGAPASSGSLALAMPGVARYWRDDNEHGMISWVVLQVPGRQPVSLQAVDRRVTPRCRCASGARYCMRFGELNGLVLCARVQYSSDHSVCAVIHCQHGSVSGRRDPAATGEWRRVGSAQHHTRLE